MADYYKNAILEQLEEMSENQLCFYAGNIVQCCKGKKYKTVGNFIWRYKEVT